MIDVHRDGGGMIYTDCSDHHFIHWFNQLRSCIPSHKTTSWSQHVYIYKPANKGEGKRTNFDYTYPYNVCIDFYLTSHVLLVYTIHTHIYIYIYIDNHSLSLSLSLSLSVSSHTYIYIYIYIQILYIQILYIYTDDLVKLAWFWLI